MNRRILTISLTLLCLTIAVGCSDDNGTGSKDNATPAELAAEWTLTSGSINGASVPLATLLGWESSTTHAVLVVAATGTYSYFEKDADSAVVWQDSGVFRVNGSNFTLSGGQIPISGGQWAVNGTQLTMTMSEQGYTYVILATKPEAP